MKQLLSLFCLCFIATTTLAESQFNDEPMRHGGIYVRAAGNYNWIFSHDVKFTQGTSTLVTNGFHGVKIKTSRVGGEASAGVLFPLQVYYLGVEAEYQYLGTPNLGANQFIRNLGSANSINNKTIIQTAGINLRLVNFFAGNNRAFIEAGGGAVFFNSTTTVSVAGSTPSAVTQKVETNKPYVSAGLGLGHDYTPNVEFDVDAVIQYLGNYNLGTFYNDAPTFSPLTMQARNVYVATVSFGVTFSA